MTPLPRAELHAKRKSAGFNLTATVLALGALAALAACGGHTSSAAPDGPTAASATDAARMAIPPKPVPSPQYDSVRATAAEDVLTYHNDNARTGLAPDEPILTPADVGSPAFGKLFSDPVDGFVYAEPLYVSGVNVPGKGRHNVVYVATENDTVYAFDADAPGPPLWRHSLIEGGSPVAESEVACGQIVPRIGITSTPVIDRGTDALYVVAMVRHQEQGQASYAQRLHALDIASGAEKPGSPVSIAGAVAGKGAGSVNGKITFDPFAHLNRPALALANGMIYIAFGSHCDLGDYHGWLFAYDAAHLRFRAIWNTAPNGEQAAIWQTGDAPAVDPAGRVYVLTGNGTFDAGNGGPDYGDSFVKLALEGNSLHPVDFFTPFDQDSLNSQDLDFGSGGPILLPDQPGAHPHLVIGAGKNAVLYVVDREKMGHFRPKSDSQIVQAIREGIGGVFSTPAYWNGFLYLGSVSQPIKAFALASGRLSTTPVSQSPDRFDYPGTTPSVSSSGSTNGIVWALDTSAYVNGQSAILRAYDATNLAHELYHSPAAGADGPAVKFTTPMIAHGHVYFGTQNSLEVYGLRR